MFKTLSSILLLFAFNNVSAQQLFPTISKDDQTPPQYHIPVSYTHLDVYKRQVFRFSCTLPSIIMARLPTAIILPVVRSMATIEGSSTTTWSLCMISAVSYTHLDVYKRQIIIFSGNIDE